MRHWRSISTPGPGRPAISQEVQQLIRRMAVENGWPARRIHGELSRLGLGVSLATISHYLPKALPRPGPQQSWMTFLRNHREVTAGMDFFVVHRGRARTDFHGLLDQFRCATCDSWVYRTPQVGNLRGSTMRLIRDPSEPKEQAEVICARWLDGIHCGGRPDSSWHWLSATRVQPESQIPKYPRELESWSE